MATPGGISTPPRGRVDFAVLGDAFEIVKNNLNAYIVFTLIGIIPMVVVTVAWYILFIVLIVGSTAANNDAIMLSTMFGSYPIMFALIYATMGVLYGGLTNMTVIALQGRAPTHQDGLEAFKQVVPLSLLSIAYGFLTTLGVFACIVGTFVVGGVLMTCYTVMLVEKKSVVDSLKRSYELAKDHWLMAGTLYLVLNLLLGVASNCCILILFAFPWIAAAYTLVYRDLAGMETPVGPTNYPRTAGNFGMPEYNPSTPPADDPFAAQPPTDQPPADPDPPTQNPNG